MRKQNHQWIIKTTLKVFHNPKSWVTSTLVLVACDLNLDIWWNYILRTCKCWITFWEIDIDLCSSGLSSISTSIQGFWNWIEAPTLNRTNASAVHGKQEVATWSPFSHVFLVEAAQLTQHKPTQPCIISLASVVWTGIGGSFHWQWDSTDTHFPHMAADTSQSCSQSFCQCLGKTYLLYRTIALQACSCTIATIAQVKPSDQSNVFSVLF